MGGAMPGLSVQYQDGEVPNPSFATIADQYRSLMRRLALVVAPRCDPDDVVQEAMIRAWRKRDLFNPDRGEIRTWLLAITADQARRSTRRSTQFHLAEPELNAASGASTHIDIDLSLDIRRAIARLPPRQRAVVVLHYYVDLPLADIADILHCAVGTVKSNLSDARTNLAKSLELRRARS